MKRLLPFISLAALAVLVYAGSLDGPFVFDDWHVVEDNPAVHGLAHVPRFFTDLTAFSLLPGNRDYRPLFLSAMAFCWWLGGGSTVPFHALSIALHAAVTLLAFIAFRRTFALAGRLRGDPTGLDPRSGAFAAAALFAVHPLASQAVLYVSAQSELWAACFSLLSFVAFLSADTGSRRGWAVVSWAAYVMALLGKPSAVSLPLMLVAADLLLFERPARGGRALRLVKHLPYLAIGAIYVALRLTLLPGPVAGARPRWEHVLTQTEALVTHYLARAVWPGRLSVDREWPVAGSLLDPSLLSALVVLAAIGLLLVRFRRQRAIVFWSLWFPGCMLLTSYGVVLIQVVNEHRVYLSLVGFCAVAGRLLALLPARLAVWTGAARRRARLLTASGALVVLVAASIATHARTRVWASELTLWGDAARKDGTWRAHMNYGLALESAGRRDEALAELERAVELGPYAFSHINLGLAYLRRERPARGLAHLEQAVRLWPDAAEPHFYMAYGLELAGRPAEAERALERALEHRPGYVDAWRRLAELRARQGRAEEAREAYRRVLEIEPSRQWAVEGLAALDRAPRGGDPYGLAELGAGRFDDAVAILERSRVERPGDPDVLFNLGFGLQRLGRRAAAIEAYEALIALAPDHRQGHFNLAYAYLDGQTPADWRRSVELFERTLAIDPSYHEVSFHLATAWRKLGDVSRAEEADRRYLEHGAHADLVARARARLAGR